MSHYLDMFTSPEFLLDIRLKRTLGLPSTMKTSFEKIISSEITKMVETIRAVRDQIAARDKLLQDNPDALELVEMGHELITQLDAIEEKLHNPHAEVAYDILAGRHGGAQLYSRLSWLFEGTREHDSVPTQGMREVGAEMAAELATQREALDEVLTSGLNGINKLTTERGLPSVITR